MMQFLTTTTPLDPAGLRRLLSNPDAGALVVFEGWVRSSNEGERVLQLEYEAYEPLASTEGDRIICEAVERFGILQALCRHRVGMLAVGDLAVWIGVTSSHRDSAFDASRYIINEIKQRVPIWKKEYYTKGTPAWLDPTSAGGST
jgi:molybdopterin synthase catalytic subunit